MADSITARLDDPETAIADGAQKIRWAREQMPILDALRDQLAANRPFDGEVIGMAMHVEATTAVLVETLVAGGAEVAITGCNPLSTQDDVSAALDDTDGVSSYAMRGLEDDAYYAAIDAVLDHEPTITIDDGADLVFRIHEHRPELIDRIKGGCEETTTGVHRLRAMAADGALDYPMFAVNDTPMKRLFDNVHGTGEASLVSIALTTNCSIAGKTVVVAGFGQCGRGVARKADGMDADVIVTEVDPRRALEAYMDGFRVMPMVEAASEGDLFVTTTGNRDVITPAAFDAMADGAILANAGHFDVEIDLDGLESMADETVDARDGVTGYVLPDGRQLNVLADGRLVNLATPVAEGHPVEVMDQSFAIQAVGAREIATDAASLDAGVHAIPDALDREVAEIKLDAEGVAIDALTDDQREYIDDWQHGT